MHARQNDEAHESRAHHDRAPTKNYTSGANTIQNAVRQMQADSESDAKMGHNLAAGARRGSASRHGPLETVGILGPVQHAYDESSGGDLQRHLSKVSLCCMYVYVCVCVCVCMTSLLGVTCKGI